MKKAARVIVNGTVQGVFFRQFCKENADKLGLTGFVRNLTGGDVELVLEGEGGAIENIIAMVKKGPEHSMIKSVQVEERKWEGNLKGFKVLRF